MGNELGVQRGQHGPFENQAIRDWIERDAKNVQQRSKASNARRKRALRSFEKLLDQARLTDTKDRIFVTLSRCRATSSQNGSEKTLTEDVKWLIAFPY